MPDEKQTVFVQAERTRVHSAVSRAGPPRSVHRTRRYLYMRYVYMYNIFKHQAIHPVGFMLEHRVRCWPNIKPTLGERLVFDG